MAKRKSEDEAAFERQERQHLEERRRQQARLASDWLHIRNPGIRPKSVQIQKQIIFKDGRELAEPETEFTQWIKIPQVAGRRRGEPEWSRKQFLENRAKARDDNPNFDQLTQPEQAAKLGLHPQTYRKYKKIYLK